MPRRPPKAHQLIDYDGAIGVVRCPEGDTETFARLAAELAHKLGYLADETHTQITIAPPTWSWWRCDPVSPTAGMDFAWQLTPADGPGPRRWQGALIHLKASARPNTNKQNERSDVNQH